MGRGMLSQAAAAPRGSGQGVELDAYADRVAAATKGSGQGIIIIIIDEDAYADRCRAALADLEALASSCTVCSGTDFDKENFTDRTVIICDQCEREFHVGCLRSSGNCDLDAVPQGDWFCQQDCKRVRGELLGLVEQGETVCSPDGHTWQVFHGDDGTEDTLATMQVIQDILQESFDPIIDVVVIQGILGESFDPIIDVSGQDLLPKMVEAGVLGDWHFEGMFTILLKHRGRPTCAGILRVFGPYLVELPLIATKFDARRQGHCRVLMDAIESQLISWKLPTLALPAAASAMPTWINGFGFKHADMNELQSVLSEVRLLVFPGTQVLYKSLFKRVNKDGSEPKFLFANWPEAAARAEEGAKKLVQFAVYPVENAADPSQAHVIVRLTPSLANLSATNPALLPATEAVHGARSDPPKPANPEGSVPVGEPSRPSQLPSVSEQPGPAGGAAAAASGAAPSGAEGGPAADAGKHGGMPAQVANLEASQHSEALGSA
eukprot:gene14358-20355_t